MDLVRKFSLQLPVCLLFLCSLLLFSITGKSAQVLDCSPEELAAFASELSQKTPEIAAARELAEGAGQSLLLYGGTSRELVDLARSKILEQGGLANARAWLEKQQRLEISAWHRIGSDLDLMLQPMNEEAARSSDSAAQKIKASFPETVFFKSLDVNVVSEFFKKFPASGDHFEGISNIPLGKNGLAMLSELEVSVNGVSRNLAEWGITVMQKGRFEFALNPQASPGRISAGTFLFRQVLRWIRYLSEFPQYEPSPETLATIHEAMDIVHKKYKGEVLRLLKGSDHESKKILEAIRKLQIYSKNPVQTRAWLDKMGVTDMAKDAGQKEKLIYDPLPTLDAETRARKIADRSPAGVGELDFYHRTNLSAAQNISQGALWMSNNQADFGGKQSQAAHGEGLYVSTRTGSLGYGDFFVKIRLRPDAVEGVDFKKAGDYYVILHNDAIARNANGSLAVEQVTRDSILRNQLSRLRELKDIYREGDEIGSIARSLSALLDPLRSKRDERLMTWTMRQLKRLGSRAVDAFMDGYTKRQMVLAFRLDNKKVMEAMRNYLAKAYDGSVESVAMEVAGQLNFATHPADEMVFQELGRYGQRFDRYPTFMAKVIPNNLQAMLKDSSPVLQNLILQYLQPETNSRPVRAEVLAAMLKLPDPRSPTEQKVFTFALDYIERKVKNWEQSQLADSILSNQELMLTIARNRPSLAEAILLHARDEINLPRNALPVISKEKLLKRFRENPRDFFRSTTLLQRPETQHFLRERLPLELEQRGWGYEWSDSVRDLPTLQLIDEIFLQYARTPEQILSVFFSYQDDAMARGYFQFGPWAKNKAYKEHKQKLLLKELDYLLQAKLYPMAWTQLAGAVTRYLSGDTMEVTLHTIMDHLPEFRDKLTVVHFLEFESPELAQKILLDIVKEAGSKFTERDLHMMDRLMILHKYPAFREQLSFHLEKTKLSSVCRRFFGSFAIGPWGRPF